MSQTVVIAAREVIDRIMPALNILRSQQLEIQGHQCRYHEKLPLAVDRLLELVGMVQENKNGKETLLPD